MSVVVDTLRDIAQVFVDHGRLPALTVAGSEYGGFTIVKPTARGSEKDHREWG
jgi:hypothetical protein